MPSPESQILQMTPPDQKHEGPVLSNAGDMAQGILGVHTYRRHIFGIVTGRRLTEPKVLKIIAVLKILSFLAPGLALRTFIFRNRRIR